MWAGERFVCGARGSEFWRIQVLALSGVRKKPCICGCFARLKRRYELDFGMGLSPGGVARAFSGKRLRAEIRG